MSSYLLHDIALTLHQGKPSKERRGTAPSPRPGGLKTHPQQLRDIENIASCRKRVGRHSVGETARWQREHYNKLRLSARLFARSWVYAGSFTITSKRCVRTILHKNVRGVSVHFRKIKNVYQKRYKLASNILLMVMRSSHGDVINGFPPSSFCIAS